MTGTWKKPTRKGSKGRKHGGLKSWSEYDGATVALTKQQFMFAHLIGELDYKQSDAYKAAYNVKPTTPDYSTYSSASTLAAHPKVRARIEHLRAVRRDAAANTQGEHRFQLMRMRELALAEGNVAAAIRAEELRGKLDGFYVERREVTLRDLRRDPGKVIEQIAGGDQILFNKLKKSMTYRGEERMLDITPKQEEVKKP